MIKNIIKMNKIIKNNNILKNTLILFSGQSLASIIGVFNTIILINTIGIEGNGILVIVTSYANIFNGIFNFQSFNAVIKFGAEALENNHLLKYKRVLKQAFLQDLITAIVAFLVGYISINNIAKFMNWDNNIILYIKIYLTTILINITGCFTGILRLHNNFTIIAKISVISAIIKFFMLIAGLFIKLNFIYYVFVEVIISIITSFILIYFSINTLKKAMCSDFWTVKIKFDREFTSFNLYNNIVSTVDLPVGQLVNIFINKILGISEVGIYSILVKLGSLVLRITNPLTQTLLPELSKMIAQNKQKKAKKLVKKIFIFTNLIGIVLIIVLLISTPIWFRIFMPFTFKNIALFVAYFAYIIFTSSISGVHLIFISLNLVKYNFPIVVIINIIYIILVILLGSKFGLIGVICSLAIQSVLVIVVKYIIIKNIDF